MYFKILINIDGKIVIQKLARILSFGYYYYNIFNIIPEGKGPC